MPISGLFPFESVKDAVGKEPERLFVVDVAGERRQAVLKLEEEIPVCLGEGWCCGICRLLLIHEDEEYAEGGIEKMRYDIFHEQTLKSESPALFFIPTRVY